MIVSAWNPSVLPDNTKSFEEINNNKAALPPCHAFFQFYVANGKLSCQLYQRSADIFLGVPFNILCITYYDDCQGCDLEAGEFIHTFGMHIFTTIIWNNSSCNYQRTKTITKNDFEPKHKRYSNLILMILRWDMNHIPD
jgi:thymidylate synthase